jgi:hypothetical protein
LLRGAFFKLFHLERQFGNPGHVGVASGEEFFFALLADGCKVVVFGLKLFQFLFELLHSVLIFPSLITIART